MTTALGMLLPHVGRWRSLTILTDTWAPMDAALALLNTEVDASDAPLLESLSLMRCNEFASYDDFHPAHMRDSNNRMPFRRNLLLAGDENPLPRLRSLNLTGVHVDWDALPSLLARQPTPSPSSHGVQSLDLKYHSRDVRPCTCAFRDLLRACPDLRSLSVVMSGPFMDIEDEGNRPVVHLPHLEQLYLGYATSHDACHLLRILNAPNLTTLTLEDATHPASPFDTDAQAILQYLGTSTVVADDESTTTTHSAPAGTSSNQHPLTPFPRLQDITLAGVKAAPDAFSLFFRAHPLLQHLEMSHVPHYAARGLLPSTDATVPCPLLRTLCVRGGHPDVEFISYVLPQQRAEKGARQLREVEVHVDPDAQSEYAGSVRDDDSSVDSCEEEDEEDEVMSDHRAFIDHDSSSPVELALDCSGEWGTAVRVIRSPSTVLKVDELDMDCDYAAADPYALGGAFNDPDFDEYYAGRRLWTAAG